MKLPLQIKDRNGLTVDILDAQGELVAIVSNSDHQSAAAQIVSAVNRHKALVNALESVMVNMDFVSPNSTTILRNCCHVLIDVMRDAVPHVSRRELDQITEAKTI